MPNLYLSNFPVFYRMDLYRAFARKLDCEICFQERSPAVEEMMADLPVRRWTLRNLPSLLASCRPSLVFVPEFSAASVLCLMFRKRYGYRVISTCDDSLDMIRGNDFGWKHRLARRFVPRHLDEIILHSPEVRDWYQTHFGKGLVMPILADERRVRPALERVLPLSGQLRPGSLPIIAFVGRLVALKNVPALIRAFEPLRGRARLVMIGDGPERARLETMVPEAVFTGMLSGDELLAWYNLIDVLVLPSTQEAFGAVTGEALMAGAKVVVSRKAGSSSLIREGVNGFVVDPDDMVAMTDCIDTLLKEVPVGRPLVLRENLLPCHFDASFSSLVEALR